MTETRKFMSKPDSVAALVDLGFTELEADVYSFLLKESPVTGYRVSQATGRLPGNVYKALESLQAKGAIIVDEGASRMCRAIPYTELLAILRRRYEERETRALKALSELRESSTDERVYQLRSREQVIERVRAMMNGAQSTLLVDAFPEPLELIKPDLEAAGKRGLQVHLKAYVETNLEHVQVVYNPHGQRLVAHHIGQWLIVIADGNQLLLAAFDRDGSTIHQGVWSQSVVLSYMFHCSLAAEMVLANLAEHIIAGKDLAEIRAAVTAYLMPDVVPQKTGGESTGDMFKRLGLLFSDQVPAFKEIRQDLSKS